MKGSFSEEKPKLELTVIGLNDEVSVAALVDTGFDGALMLSLPAALQIGLRLTNVIQVELADGSIRQEFVFEGKTVVDEETRPVEILLTSSEESLVGTALPEGKRINIDFGRKQLELTSS